MTKPWDRLPGERNLWYSRFEEYRLMGPNRSMLEVCNRSRDIKGKNRSVNTSQSFVNAAKKYKWTERAEAWDEEQRRLDREEWEKRRQAQRVEEWEIASKLTEKAKAMLEFPLAKVEADGQDGPTIIKPARWNMADSARMVETASKLARLSAGMETDVTGLEVRYDATALTDDELADIIRRGERVASEA